VARTTFYYNSTSSKLVTHPVSRWKGSGPSNPLMCVITFRPAATHQKRLLLVATMSISTATQGRSGGGERRRRPPTDAGGDDKAVEDAAMATAAPPPMPSLVRPIPCGPASLVGFSFFCLSPRSFVRHSRLLYNSGAPGY
jgi:hypothetical protein